MTTETETTERQVHFEIVYLHTDYYAVDMPIAGSNESTRVFKGTLPECARFIETLDDPEAYGL